MHIAISDHSAEIKAVCRRYGVKRLEVFGSAARAFDFEPASSDADFLVEFHRPAMKGPLEEYFGLRDELSALLGRGVDLVEPGAIHNPYIMGSIKRTSELVYGS